MCGSSKEYSSLLISTKKSISIFPKQTQIKLDYDLSNFILTIVKNITNIWMIISPEFI